MNKKKNTERQSQIYSFVREMKFQRGNTCAPSFGSHETLGNPIRDVPDIRTLTKFLAVVPYRSNFLDRNSSIAEFWERSILYEVLLRDFQTWKKKNVTSRDIRFLHDAINPLYRVTSCK